ncbi:MAG: hypothetical protein LC115_08290 [Bacteroidia bacterium]|nr:hypothetical protein [Bacteroidia bacterium]
MELIILIVVFFIGTLLGFITCTLFVHCDEWDRIVKEQVLKKDIQDLRDRNYELTKLLNIANNELKSSGVKNG